MENEIRYILYSHPTGQSDWIDPGEVYTSPDPDGTSKVYLLVWRDQPTCEAYIRHLGAEGEVYVRPVSRSALNAFAAAKRLTLAVDVDAFGAARKEEEPFQMTIEMDGTAPTPNLPDGWSPTHFVAFLALVSVRLDGQPTVAKAVRKGVASHLVDGGCGAEFVEPVVAEVERHIDSTITEGGVEELIVTADVIGSLILHQFEIDGLKYVLQGMVRAVESSGDTSARQVHFIQSMAERWGLGG